MIRNGLRRFLHPVLNTKRERQTFKEAQNAKQEKIRAMPSRSREVFLNDVQEAKTNDNNSKIQKNYCLRTMGRGGRVVRWCWVNFQYRGVVQFGLQ